MLSPEGGYALAVLRVTAVDRPPDPTARYAGCRVGGVLLTDRHPAHAVHDVAMIAPTAKWLRPGDEVGVVVDRQRLGDGRSGAVQVMWDRLPDRAALAADEAEAQAAELRGESPAAAAGLYRTGVAGDPARPLPGSPGGGTTPAQAQALLMAGDPATATVLAVADVRVSRLLAATMPPGGGADLTLRVQPFAGAAYEVRTRIAFGTPQRRDRIARVGETLPVRVDPTNRDRVAIDTALLGLS